MEQGLALLEEHISPWDIMKAAMLRRPLSNGKLVVDGGLDPRINGAGQNIGTEFAVIPPEQKD
jgi:hypothetical protein